MKIMLNPDKEVVEIAKQQLKDNDGFCPCSLIQNGDAKCICKLFREQIDAGVEGECYCGLWIATN